MNKKSKFVMRSGEISGFDDGIKMGGAGGGLDVTNESWAFMNGGTIKDNKSFSGGGGFVENSTFVMNDGAITGNTAFEGAGVFIGALGNFVMRGGTVSKNACVADGTNYTTYYKSSDGRESNGAGVSLGVRTYPCAFAKTGGTVYGSDGGNDANTLHTAAAGRGQAVGIENTANTNMYKAVNTTVGPTVRLYYNHDGLERREGYESGW